MTKPSGILKTRRDCAVCGEPWALGHRCKPTPVIEVSSGDIFAIGALRALLKASCANAGGMRAWGRLHGITVAYVSQVIAGKKNPGEKLLNALNLEPSTVYVFKNRVRRGKR